MNNISRLINALPKGSAYLIENPLNLRYLTKSDIDTGYLVIVNEKSYFITDSRYIEVAKNHFDGTKVNVVLQNTLSEDIKKILADNSVNSLTVEADFQTFSKLNFFEKICDNTITDGCLDKQLLKMRAVKDEYELNSIKSAQKITDDAFSHILNFIKVGVSEKDIALELEFFMRKNGAENVSFDTIAISGKNTSKPHGIPSEKKVENGDFVTMDFGCKVNGYCSDMTRTVAVGFATDKMKTVYQTVLEAQLKALDTICEGVNANEVDKAARDIINNAGFKGKFGHSTGHSVGLYIHETPVASPKTKEVLQSNNVITVEPGIYLENEFGVRIEDMVQVTKSGCINFTNSPKHLIIL